jgi:hypothetical protein
MPRFDLGGHYSRPVDELAAPREDLVGVGVPDGIERGRVGAAAVEPSVILARAPVTCRS